MWCGRGVVAPKPVRIQREGAQLQIRGTWSAGPGDDQARFLADLRALRDSAAIGYDELAARAHYPSGILKEAENGPSLPGLPILTAYVRACEGDVLDWEERWRRLNPDVRNDPNLPVRPVGASPAAVAGARAGVGVAPPDVYDPDRIKAALRGDQTRSGQARRGNHFGVSAPATSPVGLVSPDPGPPADSGAGPGGWGATPGWDATPDPGVTTANGNHTVNHGKRGPFDAAITSMPEAAETAPADNSSWPQKSATESRPAESGLTWPEQTGNGQAAAPADAGFFSRSADTGSVTDPADGGFFSRPPGAGSLAESADTDVTWPERPGAGLAPPQGTGPVSPESGITERFPRHQVDLSSEKRTDFWSKPAPAASADLRMPTAPSRAEEPVVTRASWSAPADTAAPPVTPPPVTTPRVTTPRVTTPPVTTPPAPAPAPAPASPVGESTRRDVAAAASAQPLSASGSAGRAATSDPVNRRPDRYFPVRLLVVVVIAALIGSALVLLLK
jgi:hypothetical protein